MPCEGFPGGISRKGAKAQIDLHVSKFLAPLRETKNCLPADRELQQLAT
jgi:hypothetical protein